MWLNFQILDEARKRANVQQTPEVGEKPMGESVGLMVQVKLYINLVNWSVNG